MKQTYSRRYRPRAAVNCEGKKGCHENFFGDPEQDLFFQPSVHSTQEGTIHRKCAECEKEDKQVHRAAEEKKEEVHRMEDSGGGTVYRAMEPEKKEEKPVQRMATAACAPMSMGGVSRYIGSLPGKGAPLPAPVKSFFEARMRHDFSGVRVHTGEEAARSAKAVRAKAYTTGSDIVFNEGQYDVSTGEGKKLLAHELAHVVQQERMEGQIGRKFQEGSRQDSVDLAEMFFRINAHQPGVKYFSNTDPYVNGQSVVGATSLLKLPGTADLHTENKKGQFESTVTKHDPTDVTYKMELPTQPKHWIADEEVGLLADLFGGKKCQVRKTRIVIDGQPDVKTVHDKSEAHEQHHVNDIKDLDKTMIDKYDKDVVKVVGRGKDEASSQQDATDQAGKLAETAWSEFSNEFNNRSLGFHMNPDKSGDSGHFTEPVVTDDCRLITAKAYHVK